MTANCYHPGWVSTGFGLNNQGFVGNLIGLAAPILARSPNKGAETMVWLATSPDAAQLTGQYLKDRKASTPSAKARDDALATGLWTLSEQLTAN